MKALLEVINLNNLDVVTVSDSGCDDDCACEGIPSGTIGAAETDPSI